jgi:hypothetical protein
MDKVEYPKMLYHAEFDPCVVHSAEEQAALGAGWCESPAEIPPQADPVPAKEPILVEIVKPARKAKVARRNQA